MSAGVAEVRADRFAPVFVDHLSETAIDRFPRFVPRHFDVSTISLEQRLAEPVGVFVQLLERRTLRTDVTL